MRWGFLRFRGRREQSAQELDEHLRLLTEEYVDRGYTPDEAARLARIKFGNVAVKREEIQDMDRLNGLRTLVADLRY